MLALLPPFILILVLHKVKDPTSLAFLHVYAIYVVLLSTLLESFLLMFGALLRHSIVTHFLMLSQIVDIMVCLRMFKLVQYASKAQ